MSDIAACTCRNFGPVEYREVEPRCRIHAAPDIAAAVETVRKALDLPNASEGEERLWNLGPLLALANIEARIAEVEREREYANGALKRRQREHAELLAAHTELEADYRFVTLGIASASKVELLRRAEAAEARLADCKRGYEAQLLRAETHAAARKWLEARLAEAEVKR
jgi:hypothetical protein